MTTRLLLVMLLACNMVSAQRVDTISIESKVFNTSRKIKIALPDEYADKPDNKYIVAYLFDAQSNDFFNFYTATIRYLSAQGLIKPMIVVGIESANRQYEFTPKAKTPAGEKYFKKSGGASLLAAHLGSEVLPVIAKKYRTLPYNIALGHSLGATFVTYCMLNDPQLFNAVIAVSPNYQYDNLQMVEQFDSLATAKTLAQKFFYLAHGNGDNYEDKFKTGSVKIDSLLSVKKIPGLRWEYKNMDNHSHATTPMEGFFKGLVSLEANLGLPYEKMMSFFGDSNTVFIDQVKEYYKPLSQWSGLSLPLADEANTMAYNCFYSNKKREAITLLKWGIALHPDNINLYDSMGEMLQDAGDKVAAAAAYKKGIEVLVSQKERYDAKKYESLQNGFKQRLKAL